MRTRGEKGAWAVEEVCTHRRKDGEGPAVAQENPGVVPEMSWRSPPFPRLVFMRGHS